MILKLSSEVDTHLLEILLAPLLEEASGVSVMHVVLATVAARVRCLEGCWVLGREGLCVRVGRCLRQLPRFDDEVNKTLVPGAEVEE